MLHLGGSIGYWRGDIKGLVDDIAALRPTLFCGETPLAADDPR